MQVKEVVEKYADLMEKAEKYIWENPEVGYKEFKTTDFMIKEFEKLGYEVARFDGITGFTTYFDTGRPGATVLVLAELDSLICFQHPDCDKKTGAVHICGHNTQCASILGVAGAIKEKAVSGELSGKVKFGIVPAEEGIEISYRQNLVEKGEISFTSGKPECIKRGLLDDVDVAFMVHGANLSQENCTYSFAKGSVGVIRKRTVITGKSAHAGGSPWDGINALYAAELVLAATNALRETFRERDCIRFHSIITNGGDAVNAIPQQVIIESYVRGASPEAIRNANKKINRAIAGACVAIGAKVKIIDSAGSSPQYTDKGLLDVMTGVAESLVGKDKYFVETEWRTSSTDMGDVSCLVPSVHGYVNSHLGALHGKDYVRVEPRKACVNSALLQVNTLVELLKDGSKKAYEIKNGFTPKYASIKDYVEQNLALSSTYDCIEYDGDNINIRF